MTSYRHEHQKLIDTRCRRTQHFEVLEKNCQFYRDFREPRNAVTFPGRIDSDPQAIKPFSPEQQQMLPSEVPATPKLYPDGKIEQFWYREDKPSVIFPMNVDSVEHAKATVEALPLVKGGFVRYELNRNRSPTYLHDVQTARSAVLLALYKTGERPC
jgi:hypothetical protein